MKLNIKKPISEYEIKKEGSMVDIPVQEIGEDEVAMTMVASLDIKVKKVCKK